MLYPIEETDGCVFSFEGIPHTHVIPDTYHANVRMVLVVIPVWLGFLNKPQQATCYSCKLLKVNVSWCASFPLFNDIPQSITQYPKTFCLYQLCFHMC